MKVVKQKKLYLLPVLPILVVAGIVYLLAPWAKAVELDIFAYDDCGGCFAGEAPCKPCTILEGIQGTYYGILEEAGAAENGVIRVTNLRSEAGREACERFRDELRIGEEEMDYPLVILNGESWFAGETAPSALAKALGKRKWGWAAFEQEQTASFAENEIIYFYSEYCGDCIRAGRTLDSSVELLEAQGVTIVRYNVDLGEYYALLGDYLDDYGIGHKSVTVPYLFWGERYCYGSDDIRSALDEWIGGK